MGFRHIRVLAFVLVAVNMETARAQETAALSSIAKPADLQQPCMAGMQMPRCADKKEMPIQHDREQMTMEPEDFLQSILRHAGSGTGVEPISTPSPMLMTMKGPWMLMFH